MKWVLFTKRTNSPKLEWIEEQLDHLGIPHRRNGESLHAPILEVAKDREDDAWAFLDPIDGIPDNVSKFQAQSLPE